MLTVVASVVCHVNVKGWLNSIVVGLALSDTVGAEAGGGVVTGGGVVEDGVPPVPCVLVEAHPATRTTLTRSRTVSSFLKKIPPKR
jgi:hypothetical protein